MTCNYTKGDKNFIISIVYTENKGLLKRSYRYFIKSHHKVLKECDTSNKMFNNNKFVELKGSAMSLPLKKEFVSFLCKQSNFKLFFIIIDNQYIEENFYNNTARAFNYILRLALEYILKNNYIPKNDEIDIQIDERNERTGARQLLQEYLNMELQLEQKLTKEIKVTYFDSADNQIIQLADVFANICYSHQCTSNYSTEFKLLEEQGILQYVFKFPPVKKMARYLHNKN